MPECPTPCDDDCEALCHEDHQVTWKKDHTRDECPAYAITDAMVDAAARVTDARVNGIHLGENPYCLQWHRDAQRAALTAARAVDPLVAENERHRAILEWVQQHDHSHDAQLARVVAEGLRGEGTA